MLVTGNTVQQQTVISFPIVITPIVIFIAVLSSMTIETQHHAWVVCAAVYP